MSYQGHANDPSSRTVIDVAVGILIGRRGCSPGEAFAELVRIVRESGVGIGSLAAALVALASGNSGTSAAHLEALNAWGALFDADRRLAASR